ILLTPVSFITELSLALPGRYSATVTSNIAMEVTVAEYRPGNAKDNSVMKLTGVNKMGDVTLKRGVIGSLDLYAWLDDIRNGNQSAFRDVTIQLQSEDHTQIVQTWHLLRARITKHV